MLALEDKELIAAYEGLQLGVGVDEVGDLLVCGRVFFSATAALLGCLGMDIRAGKGVWCRGRFNCSALCLQDIGSYG